MPKFATTFTDADSVIEDLHASVDEFFDPSHPLQVAQEEDTVHQLKLALHEWVANLAQHAQFPQGFSVTLDVESDLDAACLNVKVFDTSTGFDLKAQLITRYKALQPLPLRGMGLLMVESLTEELTYVELPDGRYCLSFLMRFGASPEFVLDLF